jgi:DNA polymerase-3 subunit alpha
LEAIQRLRMQLHERAPGQTSKDTIPVEVTDWIHEDAEGCVLSRAELDRRTGVALSGRAVARKSGYRRSTLWRVAMETGSRRLRELAASDVFWDRVASIEPKGEEETYDLTVEIDHNFVADGLIVHNSHSAAYALVAYQCAWLKAHYPAEFMAATLTSEMSDSARSLTLIEECRRLGIALLPPDVNRSEWKFTIEDGRIRVGLGAVRNVGQGAVEAVLRARTAGGAFKDLFDLASRSDPGVLNRRVVESLAQSGACDALGPTRAGVFAGATLALDHAASVQRERASGQSSLFGGPEEGAGTVTVGAAAMPTVAEWSNREKSTNEKAVLGFYLSEHPLEHLRAEIERVATTGIAQALEQGHDTEVRVVGITSEIRQITTRNGKLMGSVVIEDLSGRVECTLFPEAWENSRATLKDDTIVVAAGRVEVREDRGAKLLLNEIRLFEQAREQYRPVLQIELRAESLTESCLEELAGVLSAHPGDSEVYLYVVKPDHSRLAMRSRRWKVGAGDRLVAALKERVPSCRVRWGKGAA